MKHQIKYAMHEPTQRVMHVYDAPRGLACNCSCFKCKEKLEAVKGDIREWHFRHSNNTNCKGGPETAIHKLAKQIIADNFSMLLPDRNLYYSDARIEQRLEQYTPDVSVVSDGVAIHFEVLVTHAVDEGKKLFYTNGQHKSIEIDLQNIRYDSTPEEVENIVLRQVDNKRIIFWESPVSTKPVQKESTSPLKVFFAVAAIIWVAGAINKWMNRRNRW